MQGKEVVYMAQNQSDMIERLTRQYTKTLGRK
jgi:hypothetical protein